MSNKLFTLALLQNAAQAVMVQRSPDVNMNGDLHGDLHIHQYAGSSNIDDIQYIHAIEVTDLATGEIVAGDVLLHVGGFFTSL